MMEKKILLFAPFRLTTHQNFLDLKITSNEEDKITTSPGLLLYQFTISLKKNKNSIYVKVS